MSDPNVINMGCRLNTFESEVMRDLGRQAELKDIIIFNTCAVTSEAERQARQLIRREKRRNPNKRIVVSGCAAQLNPEVFSSMPEVDHVLGNEEKLNLDVWKRLQSSKKIQVAEIMKVKNIVNHPIKNFGNRVRAFLQVQQGCDHRCTFCIIPYARGGNRSLPIDSLVQQARDMVTAGFQEIVITGVDLCSYGEDLAGKPKLGSALSELLEEVAGIKRLRLSSLDPANLDRDLFKLLAADKRFMPYIHLSIQALDDMILKRMRRRHSVKDVVKIVKKFRDVRPGIALGADLIAGFPTESDEMFENTLSAVKELGIPFLHVFPYSERPGTPATKMPQIKVEKRKKRGSELRKVGESLRDFFLENQLGHISQVLIEKGNIGRTEHAILVELDQNINPGTIVNAIITDISAKGLRGKILDDLSKS